MSEALPESHQGAGELEPLPFPFDLEDRAQTLKAMLQFRDILISDIADAVRNRADWPSVGEPFPRRVLPELVQDLSTAEVVMWRNDLLRHAQLQAGAFKDEEVHAEDFPRTPEFWVQFGNAEGCWRDLVTDTRLLATLIIPIQHEDIVSAGDSVLVVDFYCPIENHTARIRARTRISSYVPLVVGKPPHGEAGSWLLSSLRFRASAFICEDGLALPRAARRQMKRAGETPPTIRVVNLRRKERAAHEQPHLTDFEYQCQWFVRPHVRRLNKGTNEERPIWIPGYIKGPEGKPLKPPTETVQVVKR